jgi:hypothetical protein
MCFKLLIIICLLFQVNAETVFVDGIAAVVNEEIITVSDVEKLTFFSPEFNKPNEKDSDYPKSILEDLINYKVVYLEYRGEYTLSEEDYEEIQLQVISKFGSYNKFIESLKVFDMDWKDFKDFIREKLLFEKVIKEKFQEKIDVNLEEIKEFYNKEYLPMQQQLNLEPKSLIEMSSMIELQLKKIRINKTLSSWLKEIKSSYKIELKIFKRSKNDTN